MEGSRRRLFLWIHDGEVHIERPDGSRVIVIVNIAPLKDDREEVIGAINCFCDVTERKKTEEIRHQAEKALRLANGELNPLFESVPPHSGVSQSN